MHVFILSIVSILSKQPFAVYENQKIRQDEQNEQDRMHVFILSIVLILSKQPFAVYENQKIRQDEQNEQDKMHVFILWIVSILSKKPSCMTNLANRLSAQRSKCITL